MDPNNLPSWLKHFQTICPSLFGTSTEIMGDFVNNRCRKPESEPLWPENSQLIFYTRDTNLDRFCFYRYSILRKKAAKFLNFHIQMPQSHWRTWFCAFDRYLFAYVKGYHVGYRRSHLFCYDLVKNEPKQWEMPFLDAEHGLCLYPTQKSLYIDVCYPENSCRISYRHQLNRVYNGESVWEIVADVDLPCETEEMYEFDVSADSRAYDPRNHWEEDKDSDNIYVFNEQSCKWEKILCTEATGDYKDIVDTYTPCLRAIYRSFAYYPEIFHPGPDTKATEIFVYSTFDGNSEQEEDKGELYKGNIRPVSLRTSALESLLAKCPEIIDWEMERLKKIGIPDQICEMFVEHRNWDEREVVSFVVGQENMHEGFGDNEEEEN